MLWRQGAHCHADKPYALIALYALQGVERQVRHGGEYFVGHAAALATNVDATDVQRDPEYPRPERGAACESMSGAGDRHEDVLRDVVGPRVERPELPPRKARHARSVPFNQVRQGAGIAGHVVREQTLVVTSQNRGSRDHLASDRSGW